MITFLLQREKKRILLPRCIADEEEMKRIRSSAPAPGRRMVNIRVGIYGEKNGTDTLLVKAYTNGNGPRYFTLSRLP